MWDVISKWLYKYIAKKGKSKGYKVASEHLEFFLRGSDPNRKNVYDVSTKWLMTFSEITDAVEVNNQRATSEIQKFYKKTGCKGTCQYVDHWVKQIEVFDDNELYYASGDSALYSKYDLRINIEDRYGCVAKVSGNAYHLWYDVYDWHAGLSVKIEGIEISDDHGVALQKSGQGRAFTMTASWTEKVEGTYDISTSRFDLKWNEADPHTLTKDTIKNTKKIWVQSQK